MNIRFFIAAWGLASVAAHAQPAAQPTPQPPAFSSALQGYQPYTDDKTGDWKAANGTTARVGGWRAYAREASAPVAVPTPVATPPAGPTRP